MSGSGGCLWGRFQVRLVLLLLLLANSRLPVGVLLRPPSADAQLFQLTNRLDFMATYKFLIVTEGVEETDYIEPEFSQAILAGAVPVGDLLLPRRVARPRPPPPPPRATPTHRPPPQVYIGAPNVLDFVPGPRSVIHIRDFPSGEALWKYLESFDAGGSRGDDGYREFHAWRPAAMETFLRVRSPRALLRARVGCARPSSPPHTPFCSAL